MEGKPYNTLFVSQNS